MVVTALFASSEGENGVTQMIDMLMRIRFIRSSSLIFFKIYGGRKIKMISV